eukprot:gene17004-23283_t
MIVLTIAAQSCACRDFVATTASQLVRLPYLTLSFLLASALTRPWYAKAIKQPTGGEKEKGKGMYHGRSPDRDALPPPAQGVEGALAQYLLYSSGVASNMHRSGFSHLCPLIHPRPLPEPSYCTINVEVSVQLMERLLKRSKIHGGFPHYHQHAPYSLGQQRRRTQDPYASTSEDDEGELRTPTNSSQHTGTRWMVRSDALQITSDDSIHYEASGSDDEDFDDDDDGIQLENENENEDADADEEVGEDEDVAEEDEEGVDSELRFPNISPGTAFEPATPNSCRVVNLATSPVYHNGYESLGTAFEPATPNSCRVANLATSAVYHNGYESPGTAFEPATPNSCRVANLATSAVYHNGYEWALDVFLVREEGQEPILGASLHPTRSAFSLPLSFPQSTKAGQVGVARRLAASATVNVGPPVPSFTSLASTSTVNAGPPSPPAVRLGRPAAGISLRHQAYLQSTNTHGANARSSPPVGSTASSSPHEGSPASSSPHAVVGATEASAEESDPEVAYVTATFNLLVYDFELDKWGLLYARPLTTNTLLEQNAVKCSEYYPIWSLDTLIKVGSTSTCWQRQAYAPDGKLAFKVKITDIK